MEVKFHTNLKHRLLGSYLNICVGAQKKHKKPIFFVDLFCSDGIASVMKECPDWNKTEDCECPKFLEKNPNKKTWCRWEGSPLIALKHAKKAKHPFFCFFNDIEEEAINKLKSRFNKEDFTHIKGIYSKDANEIYKKILEDIPTQTHTLFFLDPCTHAQLKWSTIEGISNHLTEDFVAGKKVERRPELLINFMTYTMQRDWKSNPKLISETLGVEENIWKPQIEKAEAEGTPVYTIFLKIFLEKLKEIYKQEPYFIEIKQVGKSLEKGKGSLLYYIIFISSIPEVINIFSRRVLPFFKDKIKSTFTKEWYRLKGHKSLNDF